ncbi:hypothetical protein HY489_05745 [Candidatus Woesearchaeota archaeon]|nr:hypothetical protein [Candidatus Woesearchaeota archaeon]
METANVTFGPIAERINNGKIVRSANIANLTKSLPKLMRFAISSRLRVCKLEVDGLT